MIGVSITRDQLDSLKNMIWAKMETFNPVPDPHLYRIEIVPVCNARATALIKDLYVVEIHITGTLPSLSWPHLVGCATG